MASASPALRIELQQSVSNKGLISESPVFDRTCTSERAKLQRFLCTSLSASEKLSTGKLQNEQISPKPASNSKGA